MIKNRFLAFGLFIVCFVAFWNLIDFLYTTFISDSEYHFGVGLDLSLPIIVAIVIGFYLFLRKRDS